MIEKLKFKDYFLLHVLLMFYSFSSVCSKQAAAQEFLSFHFIIYYGMVLVILFVYAILWQQILKKMPLTVAFANKAVVIIWGIVWGMLFFGETLRPAMFIGSVIIVAGIYLVVTDDE